ncbi:hypothetical protein C9I98_08630 [Photobacterium sanctipauli]|uniref:OmpR/PhoB-type domain-containing protein n=1 Tax=Photobacterium sanctipauli TaxID=1342794 RepID=A0A2T3NV12_9GAMM|nr:helix-turn-helix domain-containing protein [Photobacterium sanctipauli]PSW20114.1 hypothetical protein C9I98_08630 [Photobacterium sanctipauli]
MTENTPEGNIVKIGESHFFDLENKSLFTLKQHIELNRAEREVLNALVVASPSMVPKEELLKAGWARKEVATTSLFQTIRTLRIKLQEQETGEFIELIPKLGYKVNTCGYITSQDVKDLTAETEEAISDSKRRPFDLAALLLILIGVITVSYFYFNQDTSYNYHIEHDDENNTIVLLSQFEDDIKYLVNYTDTYIKPTKISDKLLFVAKSNEYYSVAICNKGENGCIPNTSHAISFKHHDINSFWPLLDKELQNLGSMQVLHADTQTKPGAKSYNHFLDDGVFSKNLTQHFVHQKKDGSWTFTSIAYRLNNTGTKFITSSFRGGQIELNDNKQDPFITSLTTTPEYFYWVISEEEQSRLGVNPPGEIELYTVDLYREETPYDNYLLYAEPELMLWFSEDYGFIWYQKYTSKGASFQKLFGQSFLCPKLLIGINPDCEEGCSGIVNLAT